MRRQEKAQTQQNAGRHGHTLHPKTLLQLARDGRRNRQPQAQQTKGERNLADRCAEFVGKRAVKQAPGIDRSQRKLGDDGAKEREPARAVIS